jgi:hypothetical protein
MATSIYSWRHTDLDGLECLELSIKPEGIEAVGTVLSSAAGGLRLKHRWRLAPDWSVLGVDVERWNAAGFAALHVERQGGVWRVDGQDRPDLNGAVTVDLTVTPFCNTLLVRRVPASIGAELEADVAFIDGVTMAVTKSRQRYERMDERRLRYVDLGVAEGFEADLIVDEQGIILHYEHLFERVDIAGSSGHGRPLELT